jgi:hypothetical protein
MVISYLRKARYLAFIFKPKLMAHNVKIFEGDPVSGKLIMEGEEIIVFNRRGWFPKREVEWKRFNRYGKDDPRYVKDFKIVGPAPYPFKDGEAPPDDFDKKLELKVDNKDSYREWKYTIAWRNHINPNDVHEFDPKISVDPSENFMDKFIVKLVLFVLTLLGVGLFAKKEGFFKK